MQQPEPKEIAKVMLFIEGFKNAEDIGRRIVELFDLSKYVLNFSNFKTNCYITANSSHLNDTTIGDSEN